MALTRITKGVIKPNENYDTHNINSTGIVTAIGLDVNGNGDISGNLSVGGVLTYEDVTSIDSVGIITARGGIDCNGDIDVDGHTNLDNVSIAGVSTFSNNVHVGTGITFETNGQATFSGITTFAGNINLIGELNTDAARIRIPDGMNGAPFTGNLELGNSRDFVMLHDGHHNYVKSTQNMYVFCGSNNLVTLQTGGSVLLNRDLDVDGHTNLDNVSIAGITTLSTGINLTAAASSLYVHDGALSYYAANNGVYLNGAGANGWLRLNAAGSANDRTSINLNGHDCTKLNEDKRTILRGVEIGFIFQSHRLFQEFSALENVMLPQLIMGKSKIKAEKKSKELLYALGLKNRLEFRPAKLSGGEAQRVAIARALSNSPNLILADEPTGNLDAVSAKNVFEILYKLVKSLDISCVFATHNNDLAKLMDRKIFLKHGSVYDE